MVDFTNLPELLQWLVTAAGIGYIATALSDFWRNNKWYAGLSDELKLLVFIASGAFLPVVAYLIIQLVPQSIIDAAAPHFAFAMTVLAGLLAARGMFEAYKHRPAGPTFIQGEAVAVNVEPAADAKTRDKAEEMNIRAVG